MPTTDLFADYRPPQATVKVCLRSDLTTEINRLEADLPRVQDEDARTNRTPEAPALAERILALKADAEAAQVEFVFQSIGRRAWSDLLRRLPATDEQKKIAEDDSLPFDTDEFPPAAMHASCIEPAGLTLDWWRRTFDQWGEGQVALLWQACQSAHYGVSTVPKARRASALMNASEQRSDSPSDTDSPTASS